VLTVLHRPVPGTELDRIVGAVPVTLCGQQMSTEEMWTEVERRPADRLCGACEGHASAGEVPLW